MTDKIIRREQFSKRLSQWWLENKREYPWRRTRNPFYVLVSEVFLHRTKANQVAPVYGKFIERFGDLRELANASQAELSKVLFPLGLHWRTKLLHRMAGQLVRSHGGRIPSGSEELKELPGISHYIASAVRCFAFGFPDVLLDTNTVRIAGRVFGIEVTDGSRRSKRFAELLKGLIDERHPREFNYSMIDLGALVCRPRDPLCDQCPVREMCIYGNSRAKGK